MQPLYRPEEDRAALLVPHALGHLARKGSTSATDALLMMTAGASASWTQTAASMAATPKAMESDLVEAAVRALATANTPKTRARLLDIAKGDVKWDDLETNVQSVAQELSFGDFAAVAPEVVTTDGSPVTDAINFTFANHVDVADPMTDARFADVMWSLTTAYGVSEKRSDVACCIVADPSGPGTTFGNVGDGLDVIDNNSELQSVLRNGRARGKIVRVINYCNGPGTNIIGCAFVSGWGMAFVRVGPLTEPVLWAHELGHNLGLSHRSDPRAIMHPTVSFKNRELDLTECAVLHAATETQAIGVCANVDDDDYHDLIDNCPEVSNDGQDDADADGVGDVCDPQTCGNGIIEPGEACDDGNLESGDGCRADCYGQELCGDGLLDLDEECDDGNRLACDGCTAQCRHQTTACGDHGDDHGWSP